MTVAGRFAGRSRRGPLRRGLVTALVSVIGTGFGLTAWRMVPAGESAPAQRTGALTVTIDTHALAAPAGGAARLWFPIPATTRFQVLHRFTLSPALPYRIVRDPEYGNRFLYLEVEPAELKNGKGLSVTFHVTRLAMPSGVAEDAATPPRLLNRFLRPDRLVPVDGIIAAEARAVAGGGGTALERARRLYEHVVATVHYDKSGSGWGRGDALWVCDSRRGNCTDFHSLFIGEARSQGIPARFVMGLLLPRGEGAGEIPGYHCWAQFYIAGRGWVPVDAAEASQDPARREELFGSLDPNRVQFTIGRDIPLPGTHGVQVNYAIYPLAELDGQPVRPLPTRFSFRGEARS